MEPRKYIKWAAMQWVVEDKHPGEALTLERGKGMCRSHDPLFSGQSPLPSPPNYRQCAALVPLSSMFRKFLYFQPCFGQNFSSLDPNFSKFSFLRPLFFKENPLPRPYILKPAWQILTKKKVECPPGINTGIWRIVSNTHSCVILQSSADNFQIVHKICPILVWGAVSLKLAGEHSYR